MTREERIQIIKHLKYDRSIGAYYMITDKDADEIIKALEQEPCEDAISRESVLRLFATHDGKYLYEAIRELPPVQKEPKTGHWIKSNIGGAKVCSVCNAHMGLSSFKFCPNCGAKMVEPQESEEI